MDFENCFFDTDDYKQTSKKLGGGTFGNVYVVTNIKNEIEYAAKIINTQGIFSSQGQMMFLRESLILHQLSHPAIVKFYGINFHSFEDSTKLEPTILTDYYPKGSLKQILDKEKKSIADSNWSPTKKYICMLGISDAMRYLHEVGIIHRDLKPENVLIDSDYYPRVCDFGLSRYFTNSIQISMTGNIGSPLYMAPELLQDDHHYGPSIDVYAFSILAYEIVTGKEPFSDDGKSISFGKIISKILSGQRPEFTEDFSENMKELITRCWSQDPKDRPSFESIFEELSNDFSYSYETVDEDEINDYIEMLIESRKEESIHNLESSTNKIQKIEEEKRVLQEKVEALEAQLSSKETEINELKKQQKKPSDFKKILNITICECRKIIKMDLKEKSNPYVTLRLKSQDIKNQKQTSVVYKTTNPVWNTNFYVTSYDHNDALIINMFNKNSKGDDMPLMDQLEFPIDEWSVGDKTDRKEIDIKLKKKKAGTFIFSVLACQPNIHPKILKFILIGDIDVGKSKLLIRFIDNTYFENFGIQIGVDFKTKDIDIDGNIIKLQIWDPTGYHQKANIAASYYRCVSAFILVFNITKRESFDSIVNFWYEDIKKYILVDDFPFILVGNQIDREREVSFSEAESFAVKNGMKYFEASAKQGIGVNELFNYLAHQTYEKWMKKLS